MTETGKKVLAYEEAMQLDSVKEKLQEVYKGGICDGIIYGLSAAGYSNEEIANYVGVDEAYVRSECTYFTKMCEQSGGKMARYLDKKTA